MRKTRKLICFFLLLLLCAGTALPISASASIDPVKNGSVSVTLKDGDSAVAGAEITLYKVADAKILNGSLHFAFTGEFEDFGGTPDELRDLADVRRLADYAVENNAEGEALRIGEDGFVCFEKLSLGLYLVVQTGSVQGYSDCTPFLVSVPVEADGEWIYDIDATPKMDIVRLVDITVKKVWNDGGKNRPDSVTVQLQNGDTVVDTVTLNEQNGWSYTWADRSGGDEWFVKEIDVPKGYTVSYWKDGYIYTITNTSELIQTGQLKWPVPLLAGAGLTLFAVGWILYFKGKRKDRA